LEACERPAITGEEEADDLVPDELVEERVVVEQDPRRDGVEALHQAREVHRAEVPRELAGATHVREQERRVDLGPRSRPAC